MNIIILFRYQNSAPKKPQSPEHRISCHRCGNIRKRRILCTRSTCPHTFCGRCAEKMKEEHGLDVFVGGCPVCKELCCCNNKSIFCHRKNHCYRKCPATKSNGKQVTMTVKTEDSDSEQFHDEHHSIPKPENGQYGIFDLLAAVADIDKVAAAAKGNRNGANSSTTSGNGPRKKAKTGKDNSAGQVVLCEPSVYAPYFNSSMPESMTNSLQLLQGKNPTAVAAASASSLSGDSGMDGYTFNNSAMGIIRGGVSSSTDAITLMGQQRQNQKFSVAGMETLGLPLSNSEPLFTNKASSSSNQGVSSSSSSNVYNRLPSIDSNPFAAASGAGRDAQRDTTTFDQALLDSVRSIQQHQQKEAVSKSTAPSSSVTSTTAAGAGATVGSSHNGKEGYSTTTTATTAATQPSVPTASMEPMKLLALVSSFTSSMDKPSTLPADHLLLSGGSSGAGSGGATTATGAAPVPQNSSTTTAANATTSNENTKKS